PSPIPAQECTVVPPMLTDAIPVDAVIARPSWPRPPRTRMISRKSTDLPVPGQNPVKNTFSPRSTLRSTSFCSSERTIFTDGGVGVLVAVQSFP
ncbi:hypothetical protein M405DRAFT_731234, partial [Rhizopogon salebrosus TDB-379]